MAAFARFGLIVVAYLLAAIVTGFVVTGSLLWAPGNSGDEARRGFAGFAVMVSFFVTYFAVTPAAVVVAWGEYRAWRKWWYYALAGSMIGLVLGYLFQPPPFFPWLGLGFGPISGLIYWAVAGRMAGLDDGHQCNIVAGVMLIIFVLGLLLSVPALFGMIR